MSRLSPNALGSLYMVIGSLGYVFNDALVREVTEEGPGVYQVLCLRSIGLAVVFGLAGWMRGEHTVRAHLTRPLVARVGAEVVASALFFAAIVQMEFANAQAILQLVPFAVTLVAAMVLHERVVGRQYVTILIGFLGVLIVIRPATAGFSAWSLVAVVSAMFIVVRELATRDVEVQTPAVSIAFVTAVGLTVLTGMLSLFTGWERVNGRGLLLLTLSVGSLVVGYLFTIETVRIGDLSVSAPFRYSGLLGAVLIGYLMFSEIPDQFTVVGSLIIIATGLYAAQLERTSRVVPEKSNERLR